MAFVAIVFQAFSAQDTLRVSEMRSSCWSILRSLAARCLLAARCFAGKRRLAARPPVLLRNWQTLGRRAPPPRLLLPAAFRSPLLGQSASRSQKRTPPPDRPRAGRKGGSLKRSARLGPFAGHSCPPLYPRTRL